MRKLLEMGKNIWYIYRTKPDHIGTRRHTGAYDTIKGLFALHTNLQYKLIRPGEHPRSRVAYATVDITSAGQ